MPIIRTYFVASRSLPSGSPGGSGQDLVWLASRGFRVWNGNYSSGCEGRPSGPPGLPSCFAYSSSLR
jgi:hypothetical protein